MLRDTSFLLFAVKVAITLVVFYNHLRVQAFVTTTSSSLSSTSHKPLFAGGMGMGMGTTKSKKKKGGKNKSKNKSKAFSSSSRASSSSSSSSPFDINASVIRLEKKYDELTLNAAKELQKEEEEEDYSSYSSSTTMLTSEYVVAVRASSKRGSVLDWVPVAQLCLKRPESEYHEGASDEMVQAAISAYCRELSHLAAVGAPIFSTIARNEIQYSVESVDSFSKFVYDDVVEGKSKKNPNEAMTKAEARKELGLLKDGDDAASANDVTKSDIKQAYRKLSFKLHPDRFEGTKEECDKARSQFERVQLAYTTLSSGVRGEEGISWYESLGGRERTGFVGPVNLLPLKAAEEHMSRHKAEGALCGLDPNLVQSFIARHSRSA